MFGAGVGIDTKPHSEAAPLEAGNPFTPQGMAVSVGRGTPHTNASLPPSGRCVAVDAAPFQISELTTVPKVHYLFAICMFNQLIVTRAGRFMGLIVKSDLCKQRELPLRAGSDA